MKKIVSILFLAVCITACGPCRHCPVNDVVQKDSIYVHTTETVTVHDTTIMWKVPEASASSVTADTDTSRLSTGLAESEAWVKDGQLYHTIRNRSDMRIPILIPVPTKVVEKNSGLVRTRTVTVEVEKKLTRFQNLSMAVGFWAMGIVAVLVMAGLIALFYHIKSFIR